MSDFNQFASSDVINLDLSSSGKAPRKQLGKSFGSSGQQQQAQAAPPQKSDLQIDAAYLVERFEINYFNSSSQYTLCTLF